MGVGPAGLQFKNLLKLVVGLVESPHFAQRQTQVAMRVRRVRLESEDLEKFAACLVKSALPAQGAAEVAVWVRGVGLQPDGIPVLGDRLIKMSCCLQRSPQELVRNGAFRRD